jgi:hypothetical protein
MLISRATSTLPTAHTHTHTHTHTQYIEQSTSDPQQAQTNLVETDILGRSNALLSATVASVVVGVAVVVVVVEAAVSRTRSTNNTATTTTRLNDTNPTDLRGV